MGLFRKFLHKEKNSEKGRTSFNDLSDDEILQIFDNLRPGDAASLSLTNKRNRSLAPKESIGVYSSVKSQADQHFDAHISPEVFQGGDLRDITYAVQAVVPTLGIVGNERRKSLALAISGISDNVAIPGISDNVTWAQAAKVLTKSLGDLGPDPTKILLGRAISVFRKTQSAYALDAASDVIVAGRNQLSPMQSKLLKVTTSLSVKRDFALRSSKERIQKGEFREPSLVNPISQLRGKMLAAELSEISKGSSSRVAGRDKWERNLDRRPALEERSRDREARPSGR